MKFSLIIPAYNEEKTLSGILEIVFKIPEISQVIVVDDGSTDNTSKLVKNFLDEKLDEKVELISYKKNRGKGFALWEGLTKANNEAVIFWDADYMNLKQKHIYQIIRPFENGKIDAVMGVVLGEHRKSSQSSKKVKRIWHWINKNYGYTAAGQRVGWKKDFLSVPHLKDSRYGADLLITDWFLSKEKKIKKVFLADIGHLSKKKKWGKAGLLKEISMIQEIVKVFKYLQAKSKLALGDKKVDKD